MKRIIGILLMIILLVIGLSGIVYAQEPQSSSTDSDVDVQVTKLNQLPPGATCITFDEFAIDTVIDDEYRPFGIIFDGDPNDPFITTDGAQPTSPVLSGDPIFTGDIKGTFVVPGTDTPTVATYLAFDAGYFDATGSTRIEWFDLYGNSLGIIYNTENNGIEHFVIDGDLIASWKIGSTTDPAGFSIDNVCFVLYEGAVGGEAHPVNKVNLIAPWLALAAVITVGGVYLVRRRVHS